MERYGGSIYGTRGGPILLRPWGVTTQRGDSVFVHLLDWEDPELSLPSLPRAVRAATLFATGVPVPFRQSAGGVTLSLPPRGAGEVDQVVVLRMAR